MRLLTGPFRLPTAALAVCGALALAACGSDQRPSAPATAPVPHEQQVRDVAKTLLRAYAAQDYHRLCAQFAPGTFDALIAAGKVESCERLFADAPGFEAPSPQQIDRADARVRGDRATLVFEDGVDPMKLRRVGGRWVVANEAEVSEG